MRKITCLVAIILIIASNAKAQCTTGFSSAALNWDNLAYLTTSGTGFSPYVTAAMAQSQYFAFGKNRLNVTYTSGLTPEGSVATHTGETGSIGSGNDIEYTGMGTVTITFNSEVSNVKFTIADIDEKQIATITAANAAATGVAVTGVKTNTASTSIAIAGSGTNTVTVTDTKGGAGTKQPNNENSSSVNIDVAGPVKTVNINFSSASDVFFISDIIACISEAAFPSTYRIISKPYTNQPGYLLTALDSSVYFVDPATGAAKKLFTDPAKKNINSLAYDPYNKIVYYTYSLTSNKTANKEIKKYDVNTETLSSLITDVTTLGMPTFISGVESGGASFYDGALYIGIEGESDGKSIIWRIDFDASLNAISATQAFGITTAGHDWGDFVMTNGVLYDFDGSASGNENVYHVDMQSGNTTNTYSGITFGIRQVGANWNDQVFNIGGAPASTGEVAPYNYNGTVNSVAQKIISVGAATPSGSWGDADGAFKPKVDFGDAPTTYDPLTADPAIHEMDTALRLGNFIDKEWLKKGETIPADADTDDALPFVPIFCKCTNTYNVTVNVWNNTGSAATLISWLDYNNNGVFDAGESVSATVSPMAQLQPITLNWTSAPTTIAANSYMYMRLRLTTATVTSANATGYLQNGEVEDWRVLVDTFLLPVHITSFTAAKKDNKAEINWKVANEKSDDVYELQRSIDGQKWFTINTKQANANPVNGIYNYTDDKPLMPATYYRLKQRQINGANYYSKVEKVIFDDRFSVTISPNPVTDNSVINIYSTIGNDAEISIMNMSGKKEFTQRLSLQNGINTIPLKTLKTLNEGLYFIQVISGENKSIQKIIIKK
jgi:hypothetical protein